MQAFFGAWKDEGVVDLREQLAELIILTASRTLMGMPPSLTCRRQVLCLGVRIYIQLITQEEKGVAVLGTALWACQAQVLAQHFLCTHVLICTSTLALRRRVPHQGVDG